MSSKTAGESTPTDDVFRRETALSGALVGVIAYLLGYAVTFALVALDSDLTAEFVSGDRFFEGASDLGIDGLQPDAMEFVGWIFYNAHFVDVVQSSRARDTGNAGELGIEQSSNLLSESATQIPELVYYLVPVAVITMAGYLLARRLEPETTGGAVLAGGSVTLGYAPLSLLGAFVFATSASVSLAGVEFSVSMAPNLMMAIVVAGLVLPIFFGAIGAILGSVVE